MSGSGSGATDPRVQGMLVERDRVARAIEQVLDRLAVENNDAPTAGGWNGAQVMWHLATVQGQVVRLLEKGVAALPPMITVPPGASWEALVASVDRFQVGNRGIKVEAPVEVQPPPGVRLGEERGRWDSGRVAFDSVLRRHAPHLALVRRDHPILGSLDGWQWALFMVRHEERHLRQLEELA